MLNIGIANPAKGFALEKLTTSNLKYIKINYKVQSFVFTYNFHMRVISVIFKIMKVIRHENNLDNQSFSNLHSKSN